MLAALPNATDPALAERVTALENFGDTAQNVRYSDADSDPTAEEVAADPETVRRLVADLRDRVAALDAEG